MAAHDPRIEALFGAARRLANPADPLGYRIRRELLASSGLSAAGIELAFRRSWEAQTELDALERLRDSLPRVARAHVLLSANVFTGALRAIALALLASPRVFVRASRREPSVPAALSEASPGCFELVDTLAPDPGDHVWAYGGDETLDRLRAELPEAAVLHAHGSGIGIAVIRTESATELRDAASRLAEDVIVFDQRGCLSPRVAFVEGDAERSREFAALTARCLQELERQVPLGHLTPQESAEVTRYRDLALYSGQLAEAGSGFVSYGGDAVFLPPVGRNLHVHATFDVQRLVAELAPLVTCVGVSRLDRAADLVSVVPRVRLALLGTMQSPPLDGPVDRRADPNGELIRRRPG